MKSLSTTLILCLYLFLLAVLSAQADEHKTKVELVGSTLKVSVAPGYHFNTKAPVKIEAAGKKQRPAVFKEKNLSFKNIPESEFQLSFYVCDDKNSQCLNEDYFLKLENDQLKNIDPQLEVASTVSAFDRALLEAKQEHKMILLDVGAPWCPACVRLEGEVYTDKKFQELSSSLIKVNLNADHMNNRAVIKKYEVRLLPTILLLNDKGEELARMIDYKPVELFNEELSFHLKNSTKTYEELKKLASENNKDAIYSLGLRSYKMNDFKEAKKWFDQLAENSLEKNHSDIILLEEEYETNKSKKDEWMKAIDAGLALYPDTYEAVGWRLSKGQFDPNVKKENSVKLNILMKDDLKLEAFMKNNTSVGTIAFPRLEAWSLLVKSLDEKKELALATENFKKDIKKIKTDIKRPGEMLMVIQYMREVQMPEEGALLRKLVKAYPDQYVYHMKLGGFFNRNKKYKEALAELKKSTTLESPLSLFHLTLLAKTQKSLGLTKELKKTIELARTLPESKKENAMKELNELLL